MKVIEVEDKRSKKTFLDVARTIYKDDPNWICPLDNEVEAIFNPAKNPFFKHGKCTRWILLDDRKQPVGRIAAFINDLKAYNYEQPTGGMGFFECVNNEEYAFLLFDTAKNWLTERGMKAMDGPINFGERDKWWGIVVDGYYSPLYCMNTTRLITCSCLKHMVLKFTSTRCASG